MKKNTILLLFFHKDISTLKKVFGRVLPRVVHKTSKYNPKKQNETEHRRFDSCHLHQIINLTPTNGMYIYWYTMRPNQRPRWLKEVEAYLVRYQLQSHGPHPEDDLNALATSLSTRIADMAHNLRSKVSVRRIKEDGETVAVHVYRNALPILVIKNKKTSLILKTKKT